MVDAARKTACNILNDLAAGSVTLDGLLERYEKRMITLDRRDRALIKEIVYGVLRWRARLDAVIARASRTPFPKIHPVVQVILRMAVYQILYLDRVPDSAAVNTAVELAKKMAPERVAGFVNGVLRTIVRNREKPLLMPEAPLQALALGKSFPEWMVRRWHDRFGLKETERLCDAMNRIPPVTLRVNTLKTDRERLKQALEGEVGAVADLPGLPQALCITRPSKAVAELTAFREGGFQVQDAAAQAVALLADPRPGETVLDACAGLGGKTGHLAQLMENRGCLLAADISAVKLERLAADMLRLGISMVSTLAADMTRPPMDLAGRFDCILVDAPCSGLGVIRRNPDTKWQTSEEGILRCARRQAELLDGLAVLLKSGGKLCYAVCSFEPEENEAVINAFCKRHPEFTVLHPSPPEKDYPPLVVQMIGEDGTLKALPHRHPTDGFFAVCLRKGEA